jgi:uncharacterized protein (DUF488 family)
VTIGHSTRTLEEFICLLQAHGIRRVVDVRTVPRSLHDPQFNKTSLPESLKRGFVLYRYQQFTLRLLLAGAAVAGWVIFLPLEESRSFHGALGI